MSSDAVRAVVRAVTDKGRSPAHHDEQLARLRREWPVLAGALDQLVREERDAGR